MELFIPQDFNLFSAKIGVGVGAILYVEFSDWDIAHNV
jgi:hypothetical protein